MQVAWVGEAILELDQASFYHQVSVDGVCYHVGEALLLKAPKNQEPYIAQLQALWQDDQVMRMSTLWFWKPEDTADGRLEIHGQREIFISTGADSNLVNTIVGRCKVFWSRAEFEASPDPAHSYYCEQCYNPILGKCSRADVETIRSKLCPEGMRRLLYKGKKRIRQGVEFQAHVPDWKHNKIPSWAQDNDQVGMPVWQPRRGFDDVIDRFLCWVDNMVTGSSTPIEQDTALSILHAHR